MATVLVPSVQTCPDFSFDEESVLSSMHSKCFTLCPMRPQAPGNTLALLRAGSELAREDFIYCAGRGGEGGDLEPKDKNLEGTKELANSESSLHPSSHWFPALPGAGPGVVTYGPPRRACERGSPGDRGQRPTMERRVVKPPGQDMVVERLKSRYGLAGSCTVEVRGVEAAVSSAGRAGCYGMAPVALLRAGLPESVLPRGKRCDVRGVVSVLLAWTRVQQAFKTT